MARIAIGGLHHETNTFAPQPATYARFAVADGWPALLRGSELPARTRGINLPIAGFVAAAEAQGHALVPLVWANAPPSGRVTQDAFEDIVGALIEDLRTSLPVDAVYLDLHGAMVTSHLEDGEGELLARVRSTVGAAVPVVASLDLHANVSDAMVDASDAMIAFRTYPHTDMAETGARCLPPIEQLFGGKRLAKAHRKGEYLAPLPWQCSTLEPARSLYALVEALEEDGAASVSLAMGFPAADVPCCGPSVLAYAATPGLADMAADRLAGALAAAEGRFAGRLWAPAEAVAFAMANPGLGPIVLADSQDNPGGGGTGDSTGLLAALIAARPANAALGLLIDPEAAAAAHAAGEGAQLNRLALGGRHGPAGVAPVVGDWEVVRLANGEFVATGPFYGGNSMALGPMAALRPAAAPGVLVVISSKPIQAADQAMFRHLGVDPARQAILALKSSVHFRADFEALARQILVVRAPGFVVADPAELRFTRLPSGIRLSPRPNRE